MKVYYRQTVFNRAELNMHGDIASKLDDIFTGDEHTCKQAVILTLLAFCGDKSGRIAAFNSEFESTIESLIKISVGKKIELGVILEHLLDFNSLGIIEAIETSVYGDVGFIFHKERFIDYCNSKRTVH